MLDVPPLGGQGDIPRPPATSKPPSESLLLVAPRAGTLHLFEAQLITFDVGKLPKISHHVALQASKVSQYPRAFLTKYSVHCDKYKNLLFK